MNDINNNPSPIDNNEESPEDHYDNSVLDSGAPTVASTPGKTFLVLGGIIALVSIVAYIILGVDDTSKEDLGQETASISSRRTFSAPPPPPPPPQQAPPPRVVPLPNMSPPPPPKFPVINETNTSNNKVRQERLRSGMMVLTGRKKPTAKGVDKNGFLNSSAGNYPKVKATIVKNLNSTISQGKIIFAVLESAIDTELQGMIRAIVSRDIYPEAGNTPMIPKGSRLVGIYNTDLFNGQTRAFVLWTRVILPSGVSVMINSESSDMLGRIGIKGFIDKHYTEIFSTAILTSILTIGLAAGTEEIVDTGGSSTTTNSDGSSTRNSSPTADATLQSLGIIGSTTKGIISDMLDIRKKVVVDQGTRINIMVNKDLFFPPEAIRQTKFIK